MNDIDNNEYYEDNEQSPNFKPERNPDDIRDERIDEELLEGFEAQGK